MENNFKPFPYWNKIENKSNISIPGDEIIATNGISVMKGELEWSELN